MTKQSRGGKRTPVTGKRRRVPVSVDIFVVFDRVSLEALAGLPAEDVFPSEGFFSATATVVRKVLSTLTPREERILRERALASIGRAREAKKRKSRRS